MNSGLIPAGKARAFAGRVKRRLIPAPGITPPKGPDGAPAPRKLDAGDRLVPSPVFLYSSERSGSTLLRMILDSHTEICAPHEMHLETLRANFNSWYGETAWKKLGIGQDELVFLLRDRLMHLQLTRTGKSIIVDKTPANLFMWRKLAKSWPKARYVFLKRHPLRMVESLAAASPDMEMSKHYERINRYLTAWVAAREVLPGPTVSYEELTADPKGVVRGLCADLGVEWQPRMLEYSKHDHSGDFRRGLGDWTDKIKSGVIHSADPLPEPSEIPDELTQACWKLGYL